MDKASTKKAIAGFEGYIESSARPLERALLHHRRAPGPEAATQVIDALLEYRNPDGGFGRALEPDYRARASSALATNIALGTVVKLEDRAPLPPELRARTRREVVAPALAWLIAKLDRERSVWPIVGQEGEAEPHAPWWTADKLTESFGGFLLNPTAECAAYLIRFGDKEQCALGLSLAPTLVERACVALGRFPGEALDPLRALAAGPSLPEALRAELAALLSQVVAELVMRDESRWGEYCLRPYRAAPSPASPGAAELEHLVRRSLDWLIEHRDADGSIAPNWSWFGLFPETWPLAEKEWRGKLALEAIEILESWSD